MRLSSDVRALIARKRRGDELSEVEVRGLIAGYMAGEVEDAQMAALLMAGVIRGFSVEESVALTHAFVDSGRVLDLSGLPGPTIDKHSTGGVGDTATLVVVPALAATGCQAVKLSGRGLGHTGGTLDKLESVPGLQVDLEAERIHEQVARIGQVIGAAGPDLAPADARVYALRDVTGTVDDPSLIAASVMSKKLAAGAEHILLDIKVGSGAFLEDPDVAGALARRCIDIGRAHGRRVGALVTQMSEPLAGAIGNALEVRAAIGALRGQESGRLLMLSRQLVAAALRLTGTPRRDAEERAAEALTSGTALGKLRELVHAQNGRPEAVDAPELWLDRAPVVRDWYSAPGWVQGMDTRRLGELASELGAGRQRRGDRIDPAVGLELLARVGDSVAGDEPAARVHARDEAAASRALRGLDEAVRVGHESRLALPLILEEVGFER